MLLAENRIESKHPQIRVYGALHDVFAGTYRGDVPMTVPPIRVRDAAALLGVSDDTVRRWIDSGALPSLEDETGRKVIAGRALADYAREHAVPPPEISSGGSSARNRLVGLVTEVVSDAVMSEVSMQCGPFTIVSLMSTRSVRELGLEPGKVTVAVVKATTVIVETP